MNTPWMDIAESYVGLKEVKGARHNKTIVEMFARVGHAWVQDDETAWCAAFVGACLAEAGLPHTSSLAARSYLNYGTKVSRPRHGCIVVFKRGNNPVQGHVGFYAGETDTHIKVLGGNQSNMVKEARYPKERLLGYRMPKQTATSRTIRGAGLGMFSILGASGVESVGGDLVSEISGQMDTWGYLVDLGLPIAKWVLFGLAAACLAAVIYYKVQDNATLGDTSAGAGP